MHELIERGAIFSGSDVNQEYKLRRIDKEVKYIKKDENPEQGWEAIELIRKIKLLRDKPINRRLEDNMWSLFYEIGIPSISSRDFTIILSQTKGEKYLKQLDVVAVDEDAIFIGECKSLDVLGKKQDLNKEIASFAANRSKISQVLYKIIDKKITPVFFFATENIEWTESNRECAREHKIQVFDEYDIWKLRDLASLAGIAAKYLLYNQIFMDMNKEINRFRVQVPALESRMGGKKYYTFSLVPEHLLKISYVHQRRPTNVFQELSDSYQRMMKPARIRQIESYIESGGFFPGNIILNFTRKPEIEPLGSKREFDKSKVGDTRPVVLTLPPYYGSAWIIDGQHRLYGYADTEAKLKETIPIVAFIKESASSQAKMFVDINRNQKSIERDLLWDLYEDLYVNSEDENEKHICAISKFAKRLNKKGPFKGRIKIPMEGNIGSLDLKTICRGLYNHGFIEGEKAPLFNNSYENSVEFAAERLDAYFNIFRTHLPRLWNNEKSGFISTTSGVSVLLSILSDILEDFKDEEINNLKHFEERFENLMFPLIEHLDQCDDKQLEKYTAASVGRKQSSELQAEFTTLIAEKKPGELHSRFLENWNKSKQPGPISSPPDLLKRNEDESLEVKASFMLDVNRYIKGDGKRTLNVELGLDNVVRTIAAFLNTKGGDLIIGAIEKNRFQEVEEGEYEFEPYGNYYILGIEEELECEKIKTIDNFELKIREFISNHIDLTLGLTMKWHRCKNRTLGHIQVPSLDGSEWCYDDDGHFFIRDGNRTIELKGRDIDNYKRFRVYKKLGP